MDFVAVLDKSRLERRTLTEEKKYFLSGAMTRLWYRSIHCVCTTLWTEMQGSFGYSYVYRNVPYLSVQLLYDMHPISNDVILLRLLTIDSILPPKLQVSFVQSSTYFRTDTIKSEYTTQLRLSQGHEAGLELNIGLFCVPPLRGRARARRQSILRAPFVTFRLLD